MSPVNADTLRRLSAHLRRPASASRSSSSPNRASWTPPKPSARRWWNCTPAPTAKRKAARARALNRLVRAARHAEKIGLECHAGHGLDFANVGAVAAIPAIVELNIGHFLVGEAVFTGIESSIRRMRALMDEARNRTRVSAGRKRRPR